MSFLTRLSLANRGLVALIALVTIMIAMSPTTLDDGVTLTMSPNIRFTSA